MLLIDLCEFVLGIWTGVFIGVVSLCQFKVGFFDLILGCSSAHSQYFYPISILTYHKGLSSWKKKRIY